jgi:phage baseplate assembly protein W
MAIELGKVNVTDLVENDYKVLGIGINTSSNSNGIFAVNYTTLTQAKSNLQNLILTRKGERLQNPNFGCDIHNLLFEQINEETIGTKIESSILDAVGTWLPYLNIEQIVFDYNDNDIDTNKISVDVKFSLKSNTTMTELLSITINN